MNTALMIIDMQKAFFSGQCKASMEEASLKINLAINLFREKGLPIIWVQDINPDQGAALGSEGFELIDCLNRVAFEKQRSKAGELFVHKQNMNAFHDPECAKRLREHNIDSLVLSGFCADYCVISTYQGALSNDFNTAILKGGMAAGSQEDINAVELKCDTVALPFLAQFI